MSPKEWDVSHCFSQLRLKFSSQEQTNGFKHKDRAVQCLLAYLCNRTFSSSVEVPAVVVGVVGMGHVPGIEKNWEKQLNIHEIMRCVRLVLTCSVTGRF